MFQFSVSRGLTEFSKTFFANFFGLQVLVCKTSLDFAAKVVPPLSVDSLCLHEPICQLFCNTPSGSDANIDVKEITSRTASICLGYEALNHYTPCRNFKSFVMFLTIARFFDIGFTIGVYENFFSIWEMGCS